MSYLDGMVAPVPNANKQAYVDYSTMLSSLFKDAGALQYIEAWGDDVPKGKVTDFWRAVAAKDDETVVFAFILWPDKATREAGWEKLMADERMQPGNMPFDGTRLIYGAFDVVVGA